MNAIRPPEPEAESSSSLEEESPPPSRFVDESDVDGLESLFDSLDGGNYSIEIQRRSRVGGLPKWGYLDKVPLSDFSLQLIKESYGGGEYRVRALDGRSKYVSGFREFVIEGNPSTAGDARAPVPADQPPLWAAQLMQRLDRLETRREPEPSSSSNLEGMLGTVKALAEVASVFQGKSSGGGGAKEMLEMYFRGRDDRAKEGGDGGESFSWRELTAMGQQFLALAQERMKEERQAMPVRRVPAAIGAPAPVNEVRDVPRWVLVIRPHVSTLVNAARMRINPTTVVPLIVEAVDRLSLDDQEAIFSALQGDTFSAELAKYFKPWKDQGGQFDAWLEEVRRGVLEAFPADDAEESSLESSSSSNGDNGQE